MDWKIKSHLIAFGAGIAITNISTFFIYVVGDSNFSHDVGYFIGYAFNTSLPFMIDSIYVVVAAIIIICFTSRWRKRCKQEKQNFLDAAKQEADSLLQSAHYKASETINEAYIRAHNIPMEAVRKATILQMKTESAYDMKLNELYPTNPQP